MSDYRDTYCPECGAVMGNRERHENWHARLASRVSAAIMLAREAVDSNE